MNKSKMLVFLLLAASIARLEAGIRNDNGPESARVKAKKAKTIAVKHEAEGQAGEMMPLQKPKTLEEQHLAIPFGKYVSKYKMQLHHEIMVALKNTIDNLLKAYSSNLRNTCTTPTANRSQEGMRLVTYMNPEYDPKAGITMDAHKYCYIYEQKVQPLTIVAGGMTDYHAAIDESFRALVEKFADHGLAITCVGGIEMPETWIVKYQNPNYKAGMPGSGKECIVYFKPVEVTQKHLEDLKVMNSQ